eukprot:10619209-Karenia_brevis.AAC.1
MNIPFRQWSDLQHAGVKEKIPPRWRNFANALYLTQYSERTPVQLRRYWKRPQKITEALEKEARSEDYIKD